jgi:formylglycine-generating enzyme required for sulfatase activity
MCYRRADSADVAGRIYDRLVLEFGKEAIFRDVDTIPIGVDFREHIRRCLSVCRVGLVVIGPEWCTTAGRSGRPRLQETADHVRLEVEGLLACQTVTTIPLFVRGAEAPEPEDLPETIQPLAFNNGAEIRRDPDFHRDMDRLLALIRPLVPVTAPARRKRRVLAAIAGLALAAAAGLAIWRLSPIQTSAQAPPSIVPPLHAPASPSADTPSPRDSPKPAVTAAATSHLTAIESATPENATKDKPFVNSLGMKFVPVPITGSGEQQRLLFSIWDTRVSDWRKFIAEAGEAPSAGFFGLSETECSWVIRKELNWEHPGFDQKEDSPVVGMNWEAANNFCAWLSKKEGRTYRLPKDAEWSAAVGNQTFPWGDEFSTDKIAGNYCGSESRLKTDASGRPEWPIIEGYNDGFPRTSPVGSFAPNRYGLFDMGGNVWQWCEDEYKASMNSAEAIAIFPYLKIEKSGDGIPNRVTRGGSWNNTAAIHFQSMYRNGAYSEYGYDSNGFRCVLVISSR